MSSGANNPRTKAFAAKHGRDLIALAALAMPTAGSADERAAIHFARRSGEGADRLGRVLHRK